MFWASWISIISSCRSRYGIFEYTGTTRVDKHLLEKNMMTPEKSKLVNISRFTSLPAAAQRWLETGLSQNSELPTRIRIDQEGSMDIRGRWTPFKAIGIYEANPLSFEVSQAIELL